jgi:small conductance mechanosensitive channel
MPLWQRLIIVGVVLVVAALAARLIDRAIARRQLDPAQVTRYRVLRRTIATVIIAVAILSALLVIPQVRAVAGGLLASSAVVGLIIGFASQRTIGNAVAGLLIAFAQPLRLGDRVSVGGEDGVVEEIGLTYTFLRTDDASRLVIPNEKLASDTIRNSTIRSQKQLAEITVQVPLDTDLQKVIDALRKSARGEQLEIVVSGLDGQVTIRMRAWADDAATAERLEEELRLAAHESLREAGVYA